MAPQPSSRLRADDGSRTQKRPEWQTPRCGLSVWHESCVGQPSAGSSHRRHATNYRPVGLLWSFGSVLQREVVVGVRSDPSPCNVKRPRKAVPPSRCESCSANCRSSRKQSGRFMEVTTWIEARRCQRTVLDGSASAQAVTRVNAEQASKRSMRRPTRRFYGEGCQRPGSEQRDHRLAPPGYWRRHAGKREASATREAQSVARTSPPGTREGQLGSAAWRRGP